MIISRFENEEDWKQARLGKITGTRLKDLINKRGAGKKLGYYELIAERLSVPDGYTDMMLRGKELECEAIARFEKETGKKVDDGLVIWSREDNDSIAISPDGYIGETEAVEVKCLGSAYFIKALLENKIPSDYDEQILQYFIVNDKLETLYFVMFDPRVSFKDYQCFEVHRNEVQDKVDEYLELEKSVLEEINKVVLELSF